MIIVFMENILRNYLKTYYVLAIWRIIYLLECIRVGDLSFGAKQLFYYLFMFWELDGVVTGAMRYMKAYIIILLLYPMTYFIFKNGGRVILIFLMLLSGISGILIPTGNWLLFCLSKFFRRRV